MQDLGPVATALRLEAWITFFPRVAEAATLGFESQPLWGKGQAWLMQIGVVSSKASPTRFSSIVHNAVNLDDFGKHKA